jgi:DNA-3-methyladenine glycosylase
MNNHEGSISRKPFRQQVALPIEFYSRETVDVAKDLLGKSLVRHVRKSVVLEGRIVEVEAYRGRDDPASHAYRGQTERNKIMFERVGLAYIYFIYGNHYCLNVTARRESEQAGAVLLRAIEPIRGIKCMLRNRGEKEERAPRRGEKVAPPLHLANGPGKLTEAMQITRKLDGADMTDCDSALFIGEHAEGADDLQIVSTPRIGINLGKDRLWRFYIRDNRFISRR